MESPFVILTGNGNIEKLKRALMVLVLIISILTPSPYIGQQKSVKSHYSDTTNRYLLKKGVSSMKHFKKLNAKILFCG